MVSNLLLISFSSKKYTMTSTWLSDTMNGCYHCYLVLSESIPYSQMYEWWRNIFLNGIILFMMNSPRLPVSGKAFLQQRLLWSVDRVVWRSPSSSTSRRKHNSPSRGDNAILHHGSYYCKSLESQHNLTGKLTHLSSGKIGFVVEQ